MVPHSDQPQPSPETATITAASVLERALGLGVSEVGICRAEPYTDTEAAIGDRMERGLFADLKFTMARPEVSCHPELLVESATSVVSAALSYWRPDAPARESGPMGRIARYTRDDAYEALSIRLADMAAWLEAAGFRSRVLVDSNHHVDRAAAIRSGVGFSGKHTNIITRRFGSWVVLGTLVTDAPLEPTPAMRPACGSCTRCIDACPTDAIIEPGVLDVNRCISYWTQSRHSIPTDIREAMGDMVYGCDICQDVCPWNLGAEKRQAHRHPAEGGVDLVEWLTAADDVIDARYERFFVPRRNVNFLRRNAIVAIGNSGRQRDAALVAPYLVHRDPMLREHARWALERLGGEIAGAALSTAEAPSYPCD